MIETNNMYHASYYLSEGLDLKSVDKKYNPRFGETVVLVFAAEEKETEEKIRKEFESGTAVCNIRSYLTALVTVRDIIYSAMKEKEKNKGTKNEHTGNKQNTQKV